MTFTGASALVLVSTMVGCGGITARASADGGSPTIDSGVGEGANPPAEAGDGDEAGKAGTDAESDHACTVPSGGATPTPGFMACGGAQCDLSANHCCTDHDSGVASCQPKEVSCDNSYDCQQAADCMPGEVCCWFTSGSPLNRVTGTVCSQRCFGGGDGFTVQQCRCDQECASGACELRPCGGVLREVCSDAYCP